ncbi:MAG: amidase [Acidobacteriota bacterium]|nr:amidase [Acidobacteriota bacterium]
MGRESEIIALVYSIREARLRENIMELANLLRTRAISSDEITKDCLSRIEKLNPTLNAFITITPDSALVQAQLADAEIRKGKWLGPLHGIPLALKDLIDTAGVRTTAASELFKDRIPKQDAEIVECLKNSGAVLLGKQNLHEFAYGGSSMISYFGAVRNAWNPECIAGGSSGGSATAVAAGLCYGAIGTDTAGSVREPASLCGVVGLKPTYGRVSARGVIPLSQSLDHVGPITRNVSDAAVIFQTISNAGGNEPADTNWLLDQNSDVIKKKVRKFRIGIPRHFFYDDMDSEVASAVEEAIRVLAMIVMDTLEIEVAVSTDRTLQAGEAYEYHRESARKDPNLYQPETLRRIFTGENVTAAEIEKHRSELRQTRHDINRVFDNVDLLVTPTTPIPAPTISELETNPELLRPREIILLRNTRPVNVWGLPAISIPCGFTRAGLPIGMQIIGPPWGESRVLQLAHAFEQATDWHLRRPALAD